MVSPRTGQARLLTASFAVPSTALFQLHRRQTRDRIMVFGDINTAGVRPDRSLTGRIQESDPELERRLRQPLGREDPPRLYHPVSFNDKLRRSCACSCTPRGSSDRAHPPRRQWERCSRSISRSSKTSTRSPLPTLTIAITRNSPRPPKCRDVLGNQDAETWKHSRNEALQKQLDRSYVVK